MRSVFEEDRVANQFLQIPISRCGGEDFRPVITYARNHHENIL
jgi:hypothetical protein